MLETTIEVYFNKKWNKFKLEDIVKAIEYEDFLDDTYTIEDIETPDSTLTKLLKRLENTYELYEAIKKLYYLYKEYSYLFDNVSEFYDAVYVILNDQHYTLRDLIHDKDVQKYLEFVLDDGVVVLKTSKSPEEVLGRFVFEDMYETMEDFGEFMYEIENYLDIGSFVLYIIQTYKDELIEGGYISERDISEKDYDKLYDGVLKFMDENSYILTLSEFLSFVDLKAFGYNILRAGDSWVINTVPTPNGRYVIWRVH